MIVSPQNEKLKLVRKLARRKARQRAGLFVAEGEDLVAAALAAGARPRFLLRAAGETEGLPGADAAEEVVPELLAAASALGSGCRLLGVWEEGWCEATAGPVCVYLDGVSDPGNIGAIVRSAHALLDTGVTLGPGCADPYGPKAIRASMGSIFSHPPARAVGLDPLPRPLAGLVAHGGEWPPGPALERAGVSSAGGASEASGRRPRFSVCLGSERDGLAPETAAACDVLLTIPLAGTAESLNVAAAAAICLERVSSLAVLATGSDLDSPNEETDA